MNRRDLLKRGGAGLLVALGLGSAGCTEIDEESEWEYDPDEDEVDDDWD